MLNYNAPIDGQASSVDIAVDGKQVNVHYWIKPAIMQARKLEFFGQLSSTINMPTNMGKTVVIHDWIPLLDDRNINDQGIDAAGATIANGNLFGSSKDIGTIEGKLPRLTETGGRVNRVGFQRITRTARIFNLGYFYEFTKDSMQFDSDSKLMDHLSREMLNGAYEMTEKVLQKDILAGAGLILYAGAAISDATVTGQVTPAAGGNPEIPASIPTYKTLMRLDQELTNNRTPRQTTVITGTRLIDTRTIPACRVLMVGPELVSTLKEMSTTFGKQAFIPVHQYAAGTTMLNGEIGSIDNFRIVEVPEMLHWAGKGAVATNNPGYRSTEVAGVEKYNIYPMVCVGEDSFVSLGFQTDGKSVKFDIITKMPGREMARPEDPYGKTGFSSIQWWYGILVKRPERIGLIKCVAPE